MYIDRCHNGVVIRPVFYLGKRYQDHMIMEGPRRGRHFASVYPSNLSYWPRAYPRVPLPR
jgi:hypothetical protein